MIYGLILFYSEFSLLAMFESLFFLEKISKYFREETRENFFSFLDYNFFNSFSSLDITKFPNRIYFYLLTFLSYLNFFLRFNRF
jgi:hypothetical protein